MSRKLALLVGVEQYESLPVLKMPSTDIADLADLLKHPHIGGFDDVKVLLNPQRHAVESEIEQLFAERNRDDLLFFYFSGHGIRNETDGRLYLALKDTHRERLRSSAIPSTYITELMDESRSQSQVLVLDCCHSGAFSVGFKGDSEISCGTGEAFKGTGRGRVVLTASDATQFAWEGDAIQGAPSKNSLFTQYLIQGLRTGEADQDGDGVVSVDEWYEFACKHVNETTPKQKPQFWSYKTEGRMALAAAPEKVIKPVPLPQEIQDATRSLLPSQRVAIVADLKAIALGKNRGMALSAIEALKLLVDDDSFRVRNEAESALASLEGSAPSGGGSGSRTNVVEAPPLPEPPKSSAPTTAPPPQKPHVDSVDFDRQEHDRRGEDKPPRPVVETVAPKPTPAAPHGFADRWRTAWTKQKAWLLIGRKVAATTPGKRFLVYSLLGLLYVTLFFSCMLLLAAGSGNTVAATEGIMLFGLIALLRVIVLKVDRP